MKRKQFRNYLIKLCVVLSFLFTTASIYSQSHLNWLIPDPIDSKVLNEQRSYRVLLPTNYAKSPEKDYSLLVLLDGQKYGDIVASNASFLAEVGEIPEHIIVALNSTNRLRDYTPTDSPYWEGDGGGKDFLRFMESEFIPTIEKHYRIKDKTRIIWGHSAAGLFALYTLYEAPNLFDAHLVNDGSLDWDNRVSERLLKNYLEKPMTKPQFLYFNSSYLRPINDPKQDFFYTMAQMLENKAPKSLRWIYQPLPKETHTSIPLIGSINGLKALYEGYKVSEEIMFKGLDAVMAHYESIKDNVGASKQIPELVLNELGYLLIRQSTDEAITTFKLATVLYPLSENAWDSLSDGYLEIKAYKKALKATKKSIELAQINKSDNLEYFKSKHSKILGNMK